MAPDLDGVVSHGPAGFCQPKYEPEGVENNQILEVSSTDAITIKGRKWGIPPKLLLR